MSKTIAVFGSARIVPDTGDYEECYQVGRALARAGYITLTGGYSGVMEAASRGAAEAGGEVHGATVETLERIGESRLNKWVGREYRYPTLRERINHLIDKSDGYVVMVGGIGTLQEFVEVWQLMRLGDIPRKPLFIYGDFWKPIIRDMLASGYTDAEDMAFLIEVETAQGIVDGLAAWFSKE
jgi:uncharacterized protein (TIGR00730 family)